MLAIRLKRLGRKGYPVYRVIVQESQRAPSSGRVVKYVGNYNPHTKETVLNKEEAEKYLSNGAQPSLRVVRILKEQKVKLPKWVDESKREHKRAIKNPEKLRRNQEEEAQPEVAEATEGVVEEVVEVPADEAAEAPAEEKPVEQEAEAEKPAEESKEDAPAEEPKPEEKPEKTEEKPAEQEAEAEKSEEKTEA